MQSLLKLLVVLAVTAEVIHAFPGFPGFGAARPQNGKFSTEATHIYEILTKLAQLFLDLLTYKIFQTSSLC